MGIRTLQDLKESLCVSWVREKPAKADKDQDKQVLVGHAKILLSILGVMGSQKLWNLLIWEIMEGKEVGRWRKVDASGSYWDSKIKRTG